MISYLFVFSLHYCCTDELSFKYHFESIFLGKLCFIVSKSIKILFIFTVLLVLMGKYCYLIPGKSLDYKMACTAALSLYSSCVNSNGCQ